MGPCGLPVGANLTAGEAARVRVLITMGTMTTDATVMDRLPNLGLICCYGTGYEGVDVGAARKRGILITHSPAANAAAVADHAIALLLAVTRRIVMAEQFVRDGRWIGQSAARMPIVNGLTGRKIGIFGYGAIGKSRAADEHTPRRRSTRMHRPSGPARHCACNFTTYADRGGYQTTQDDQ